MQETQRANLDGVEFRTFQSQAGKRMDCSVIMVEYLVKETGEKAVCWGRIQRMFVHRLWPDDDAPTKVVAYADWYEQVGTNPVNHLP
jgi:hypothetical protein